MYDWDEGKIYYVEGDSDMPRYFTSIDGLGLWKVIVAICQWIFSLFGNQMIFVYFGIFVLGTLLIYFNIKQ